MLGSELEAVGNSGIPRTCSICLMYLGAKTTLSSPASYVRRDDIFQSLRMYPTVYKTKNWTLGKITTKYEQVPRDSIMSASSSKDKNSKKES